MGKWLGILENIQQVIQVKVNLTPKGRAETEIHVSLFLTCILTLGGETLNVNIGQQNWVVKLSLGELWWLNVNIGWQN